MTAPVTRFERFEFKYWAPADRLTDALRRIDGNLVEDEVAKQSGASQVNTSLYLDSPNFTMLEQHVSGAPDRIKLRVRYYGETPGGPTFFEIKRRQVAVVMKQRAVLPLTDARAMLADLSRGSGLTDQVLQQFQYLALRLNARPRLLVRARRQAFRAVEKGLDVRVTIDRDVAWQPPGRPDPLTPRASAWRSLGGGDEPRPRALVEVKFKDERPWFLGELMRHLAPWRVSFSKYVAGALAARGDPFFTLDAA